MPISDLNLDWIELRDAVRSIAREAGAVIMQIYAADFAVEQKADLSPVTEADLAAHRIICAGLRRLTPDLPILTEEGEEPDWDRRRQWSRYWLVDPLDGTREYIKRNDEFSVNIALIAGDRAVLGVVYAPALGNDYAAVAVDYPGGGSWRFDGGERAIRVNDHAVDGVRLALSRSHLGERERALMARLDVAEVIRCGSALKSCLVAEGVADLYPRFGPTAEWDTAASQCVLEAAGGMLVDLSGQPLRYNSKESLLNPWFLAMTPALKPQLPQIVAASEVACTRSGGG